MFQYTALLGAQSSSKASQSILELDGGIKLLVDVGWDESFDAEMLKDLERQIPTLSVVLLTHATIAHLGAFAHCCKNFPLFTRIPIYATTPVISLGRTLLQDIYASSPLAASILPPSAFSESTYSYATTQDDKNPNILLQPPSADEIAGYFALINPLKYSQPHQPMPSPFSPPLNGLTITAYSAGHTLGGTIWNIQHGLESIVYAVDWNQAREHVLSGAAWLGGASGSSEVIEQLRKPTALVCSSRGPAASHTNGSGRGRDESLLGLIRDAVSKGGSVLIPSDSSARVLELAYILEEAWTVGNDDDNPLRAAKLLLASRTCGSTMRYARSMLEWMEEGLVRDFETASANPTPHGNGRSRTQQAQNTENKNVKAPFDFRYLKLLEKKSSIIRNLSTEQPVVIIASDSSLNWGFSRDTLRHIASDSRNIIILTERPGQIAGSMSLGSALWQYWNEGAGSMSNSDEATVVEPSGTDLATRSVKVLPLTANETPIYQQYLARQRQRQNVVHGEGPGASALETSADVIEDQSDSSSSSSEDSDVEHQGKALNVSATMTNARHNKLGLSDAELGITILTRGTGVHDYDVRGKRGREKMFPFTSKKRRGDDFGEMIRPEEYLRAEERDEIDGEDMRSGATKENIVGQKRRWGDSNLLSAPAGWRGPASNTQKRRKSNDGNKVARRDGSIDVDGDTLVEDAPEDVSESDEDDDREGVDGPCKAVFEEEKIKIACHVSFIDFSGLHDKRNLQMLVPLIAPRKLILVAGEKEETEALAEDFRKRLTVEGSGSKNADVFTAIVGRTIDASVDTNAWVVKLSQSLVRNLQWQQVRGLGVVAITGRLEAATITSDEEEVKMKKKLKTSSGEDDDVEGTAPAQDNEGPPPVLDVVPASMASGTRTVAQPLHVGDMRLADLRKIMQTSGLTAEFRGEGTLLVNGTVAVRKTGTGRIEVEGAGQSMASFDPRSIKPTFFEVKKKIYEGLAVVAGG
ncbi:hypothetical protein EJ05DRAFT_316392 [Pseudovirgaria hyperparasitica]|uniref:Cleavage and polyadenylation specificity factor subunit 2 n=1 Tax=Pseudovirgaria hyperparasitica TaxID=470096 RepID=A0A6A6WED3_9PEZI|nr:uncharacterized protein EJ05DRAFT_316392 [Pseudovirgaria hyperparasitica]KAF2759947.1 hypothetical protein EJ05DRAFT_316392 [Pseudovirgaria hyperparasitica]